MSPFTFKWSIFGKLLLLFSNKLVDETGKEKDTKMYIPLPKQLCQHEERAKETQISECFHRLLTESLDQDKLVNRDDLNQTAKCICSLIQNIHTTRLWTDSAGDNW